MAPPDFDRAQAAIAETYWEAAIGDVQNLELNRRYIHYLHSHGRLADAARRYRSHLETLTSGTDEQRGAVQDHLDRITATAMATIDVRRSETKKTAAAQSEQGGRKVLLYMAAILFVIAALATTYAFLAAEMP